jgi:DNA-binding NtrC family response regulator
LQRVSPDALKVLLEHNWPGNIRELQSVIRKSLLNLTGPVLVPDFLPEEVREPRRDAFDGSSNGGADFAERDLGRFLDGRLAANSEDIYAEAIEFMNRYVVTRVLKTAGGNQSRAAKMLGITRGSLRSKTQTLGLKIDQVVSQDDGPEGDE